VLPFPQRVWRVVAWALLSFSLPDGEARLHNAAVCGIVPAPLALCTNCWRSNDFFVSRPAVTRCVFAVARHSLLGRTSCCWRIRVGTRQLPLPEAQQSNTRRKRTEEGQKRCAQGQQRLGWREPRLVVHLPALLCLGNGRRCEILKASWSAVSATHTYFASFAAPAAALARTS
jgi:hypothetical protein